MEKSFDVSIAGELNLDLVLAGLPKEMPTEREMLAEDFHLTLGSSSAIVAHNLAKLGARVAFQSVVGDDDFGRTAIRFLDEAGVDTSRVQRVTGKKTGVTVLLPHGSERHILTFLGTIADLTVASLDVEFLASARHFHLSSLYLQRKLHDALPGLLSGLRSHGLTLSLDPNDDPTDLWGRPLWDLLPLVDFFMPNESELLRMMQTDDLDAAVRKAVDLCPALVLKRGPRGALLAFAQVREEVTGLQLDRVADTIGAGDSFDAGFLRALLLGRSAADAARAGNISGALSTQAPAGVEAFRSASVRKQFLKLHDAQDLLGTQAEA